MLASLIDLGWKSALITGLALLAHAAMRRRPAAERAALLQAALLALLALPFFARLLPALDLAWLPALREAIVAEAPARLPETAVATAPAPASGLDAAAIIQVLYGAGVLILSLRFAAGLWTLFRWTREAHAPLDPRWQRTLDRESGGIRRPLRVLVSPRAVTPLSWGIAPAWILIGPVTHDLPGQADAVIAHELAHIRRFDWLGLVAARIATALFWFNPLAWLVARELAREAELAADADALGRIDRYDYAQALLAVAGGGLVHREANGMAFTRTALARRITVALESGTGRRMRPLVPAILLVASLGVAGPLAAARIVRAVPVPAAALPSAPDAPLAPPPPVPDPQPSAGGEPAAPSWPGVVKAAGHSAGAALKSLNGGLKAALSVPHATPAAAGNARPGPMPKSVVSPVATRLVGRTGAQVITGPDGTTLIGGKPEDEGAAEARRGEAEARQGRIDGLRGSADGLRSSAEDVERQAADPETPADTRAGLVKLARNLRAQAAELDEQATKLTGG